MSNQSEVNPDGLDVIDMALCSVIAVSGLVLTGVADVSIGGVASEDAAFVALVASAGLLGLRGILTGRAEGSAEGRYPTPEFDRPGVDYFCADCSGYVVLDDETPEAALLIGGGTYKLCPSCAREIRDDLEREAPADD